MAISKIFAAIVVLATALGAQAQVGSGSQTLNCYGQVKDLRSGETLRILGGGQNDPRLQKPGAEGLQPWISVQLEIGKSQSVVKTRHLEVQVDRAVFSTSGMTEWNIRLYVDGEIVSSAVGSDSGYRIGLLHRTEKADVVLTCVNKDAEQK